VVDSPAHRALAREAVQKSAVLLKNDGILPLARSLRSIAVIGPNADDLSAQLGNYRGEPVEPVTILEGIRQAVSPGITVHYARGCHLVNDDASGYQEAVRLAEQSDVVIFVGGLSQLLEGEEGQHESVHEEFISQGDRVTIELPDSQRNLLKQLHETGKPVIFVIIGAGGIAMLWEAEHLNAILYLGYPGQAGDGAASVLFGDANPGGRLPFTIYRSTADLPPFHDYDMRGGQGRTYRYFKGEPLYPFGYGLSYTTFAYANPSVSASRWSPEQPLQVQVDVTNTGSRAGEEVVQLYLRHENTGGQRPRHSLQAFTRVALNPAETRTVTLSLDDRSFSLVDEDGQRYHRTGSVSLFVGGGQPGTSAPVIQTTIEVTA
jgi:beta-glucosidase